MPCVVRGIFFSAYLKVIEGFPSRPSVRILFRVLILRVGEEDPVQPFDYKSGRVQDLCPVK